MIEEFQDLPATGTERSALDRFADAVDAVADSITRHWLAIINILFLVYVGLPLLAPALMQVGFTTPARIIYLVYIPLCHQLPERSYFLFGEQAVYGVEELRASGVELSDNLLLRRSYIGDHEHGYKTALCQRDIAIYGSMFLMGIFFALRRRKLPTLSWKVYILFVIPIALDGFTQLFGLRSSNWWLRTVTGALFGIGSIWFAFPYVANAFEQTVSSPAPSSKS